MRDRITSVGSLAILALLHACARAPETPVHSATPPAPPGSIATPSNADRDHDPDTTSGAFRFGMSTALAGPAADLGLNMRDGFLAAFARVNSKGGISGRKLELLALDDGYEPSRTLPNMLHLIDEEKVLAIVGNVGTPTAIASLPVVIDKQIAFYAAFTGAGILRREPPDRYVVNMRASYAEETAAMVNHLIDEGGLRLDEFAFFTQRDGYGDAGFSGGMAALKARGLTDTSVIAHGRYERNTLAVEGGLADIMQAEVRPRAVILVGAYAPCSQFIILAREVHLQAVFLNVSFVGTQALITKLGPAGEGVIITQVVPSPESDLAMVREYRQDLPSETTPSFGSLEGYIAGRILVRALQQEGVTFDREGIVDSLENLGEFDLGIGETMRFSPRHHQGLHRVWPTIVRDGKATPFDWSDLGKHPSLAR